MAPLLSSALLPLLQPSLTSLSVCGAMLSDAPFLSHVGTLVALTRLDLSGCTHVNDEVGGNASHLFTLTPRTDSTNPAPFFMCISSAPDL